MGTNKHLIGERIKHYRKMKNLRQRDIAEQLNMTDQYISKLERGDASMKFDTIADVADVLGVDITDLLEGANSGSPNYGKAEIFAIMDTATPEQREDIISHARIVVARNGSVRKAGEDS